MLRRRILVRRVSLVILAFFVLLGLVIAFGSPASALPRDATLDRGLSNDDAYAYSLTKQASAGAPDARALLEKALDNAPDSPGFYFTLAVKKLPSVVESFDLFVEGVRAYSRSFWWRISLITLLLEASLLAAALALTLAAIVRMPKDMALLTHDINEHKVLILLPLILMPTALFGPLVFVASMLFMSGLYMKGINKSVVFIVLLLLALAPVWSQVVGKVTSVSNPIVRALVDVNEGRDNMLAIDILSEREDFNSMFSYAIALKREGRAAEAVPIIEGLIANNTDHRLYNNLGNIYVAMDRRDLAKASYLKAIEQGKSVTTLYNLSQIYRDELNFENGDKYFKQAQDISKPHVSEFTARNSNHYNRMVFDETLTFEELKGVALKSDVVNAVRGFPRGTVIPAGMAAAMLVLFVFLDKMLANRAFRCKNCGTVACAQCAENDKICPDCQSKLAESENTSPQSRVKRMLQANKLKDKQMTVIRGLSFAPPGIAQMYSGRLFAGFVYMWLFSFAIIILLLDPFMFTGLAGGNHGWLWLIMAPLVVLVYYVSIITVNRRLDKGWL